MFLLSLQTQCVFYTHSTSQFGWAVFQELSAYPMWLVASKLDTEALEREPLKWFLLPDNFGKHFSAQRRSWNSPQEYPSLTNKAWISSALMWYHCNSEDTQEL